MLFSGHEKGDSLKEADNRSLVLWRSLAAFEHFKTRHVNYEEMFFFVHHRSEKARRPIKFNSKACSYMWSLATRAWPEGWLLQPLREEPARLMLAKDEPFHVDPTKIKSIPKHEIQRFGDGWSTWRGYWAHDASAEKADTKLLASWMEKQYRDQ